jgi:hypothetical protein
MTTPIPQKTFSWNFLKKFKIASTRPVFEWTTITRLIERSQQAIIPRIREYQKWENRWDKRLQQLCGSQMTCDWSKFRPLRRDREEDWSDWLAWLLETSQTGILADSLFAQQMSCQVESFISPCVDREVCVEGRRADIVVTWKTAQKTHIEVKIWDESFDKTFETAQKLHTKAPESDWYDFILIPSESEEAWDEVARIYSQDQTVKVTVIFWDDVVRGLRRCLWNAHESVFWRPLLWIRWSGLTSAATRFRGRTVVKTILVFAAAAARQAG